MTEEKKTRELFWNFSNVHAGLDSSMFCGHIWIFHGDILKGYV